MKMKVMTDKLVNPWLNMKPDSIRRIDSEMNHDLFWMIDQDGNYGFYLKTSEEFKNIEIDIRLRGISVVKRNHGNAGELFLILNRQNDWELFLSVCNDIISVCATHINNEKMVVAVENRLKRWQVFLMQNTEVSLSLIMQMGLFAELMFLKDMLMPRKGVSAALTSWGGPEADRQDFSLPELSVEIKSYKTSRGPQVTVSSTHQLFSESKPLYLIAYGLTEAENGKSIADLINELDLILSEESVDMIHSFEQKLIEFGYMPGMTYETMYKFVIDGIRGFIVENDFPRILPHLTPSEIISVNYTIDLQLCTRFEIILNDII
ncbi:PD-(D/E)XK motif protein [Flavobacterium cerinum]|uniref:PD-(D/E)XK motif protein n=1 Tax=Flavobacterium cerinum TaxID=2502784 RepID=A0A3S3QE46_9FLAO|nr:PD-(D/E)XK motif protein [Flavobacterium cerinum]RWX02207.1 PD-(D/E)XK motif protein [Flavobacterium cerinum]